MLRTTARAMTAAASLLSCRAHFYAAARIRASPTGLSAPACAPLTCSTSTAALHVAKRGYAHKRDHHDSNAEDLSNTFFDVQDVNADRLTHFYWDSNDDADSPYDTIALSGGEGEVDEWSGESLMFVDARDHALLEEEYLK